VWRKRLAPLVWTPHPTTWSRRARRATATDVATTLGSLAAELRRAIAEIES